MRAREEVEPESLTAVGVYLRDFHALELLRLSHRALPDVLSADSEELARSYPPESASAVLSHQSKTLREPMLAAVGASCACAATWATAARRKTRLNKAMNEEESILFLLGLILGLERLQLSWFFKH